MRRRGGALPSLLLALLLGCSGEKKGEAPRGEAAVVLRGLLLYPFYLVKEGGARPLDGEPPLLHGFGVTVRKVLRQGTEPIGITASGLRLRLRDLEPPVRSSFEGVALDDGKLQLAWVTRAGARVLRDPVEGARAVGRRDRLARVRLQRQDGPVGYYQTSDGWMREADLAVPTLATRPAPVGPAELWLDVNLASQTLVVYEGDRPTFATLISAGVGAPGSAFATPRGNHRITAKRWMTSMSNLDHRGVPAYYSYEEVPLAQFIGRVALHGVYWHDGFGQVRSHGCINLSLRDALRLFRLTRPPLPAGATEVVAEEGGGTVVRVR